MRWVTSVSAIMGVAWPSIFQGILHIWVNRVLCVHWFMICSALVLWSLFMQCWVNCLQLSVAFSSDSYTVDPCFHSLLWFGSRAIRWRFTENRFTQSMLHARQPDHTIRTSNVAFYDVTGLYVILCTIFLRRGDIEPLAKRRRQSVSAGVHIHVLTK